MWCDCPLEDTVGDLRMPSTPTPDSAAALPLLSCSENGGDDDAGGLPVLQPESATVSAEHVLARPGDQQPLGEDAQLVCADGRAG